MKQSVRDYDLGLSPSKENAPDVDCKREGAQLHRGKDYKEKSGKERSLNKK